MGFWGLIKVLKEEKKKAKKCMAMSVNELASLGDEELYDAIEHRILFETKSMDVEEIIKKFVGAKLVFYVVQYFSMEVNNGGLCQYFVNSSRLTASCILDALKTIGADEYFSLLDQFISDNQIDMTDLDSFIIDEVEDFKRQAERYPFDEFDDSFYELESIVALEELLAKYVRNHIQDFCL